ncbi:MAG: host-nuclease inhibitor Gam family protein [Azoarcus sp.]|jgi:phage host-nuclease inhibitor protein Gam|nr:host-nuclease inhibitor Gam family protein [Azoarcus sp.]
MARKTRPLPALIPKNDQEASQHIARIGEIERELARVEIAMNDELSKIKERYEAAAAPLRQSAESLTDSLMQWASEHRERLTGGGKIKTCDLPAGQFGWRTNPPSVRVTGEAAVIDALHRRGLERFIRTKEQINKDAILNEPAAVRGVPGIAICQSENFFVEPFEAELTAAN